MSSEVIVDNGQCTTQDRHPTITIAHLEPLAFGSGELKCISYNIRLNQQTMDGSVTNDEKIIQLYISLMLKMMTLLIRDYVKLASLLLFLVEKKKYCVIVTS